MLGFDHLKEITNTWDYHQVPTELAMATVRETGRFKWWDIKEHMQQPTAELVAWEACQWIAALFDTYGEAIESVDLNIEIEEDRGNTYHTSWFHVNDAICKPECESDLDDDTLDAMEERDGKAAFDHIEKQLNDLGSFHFADHVDWFNRIFKEPFTSAEDARARAVEHAPRIQAWVEQRMLEVGTPAVEPRVRGPGGTRL